MTYEQDKYRKFYRSYSPELRSLGGSLDQHAKTKTRRSQRDNRHSYYTFRGNGAGAFHRSQSTGTLQKPHRPQPLRDYIVCGVQRRRYYLLLLFDILYRVQYNQKKRRQHDQILRLSLIHI